MSEIRMCDNCNEIFSLNEPGWNEYQNKTGPTAYLDAYNRPQMNVNQLPNGNTRTMHMCGTCSQGMNGGPTGKPRLALNTADVSRMEKTDHV